MQRIHRISDKLVSKQDKAIHDLQLAHHAEQIFSVDSIFNVDSQVGPSQDEKVEKGNDIADQEEQSEKHHKEIGESSDDDKEVEEGGPSEDRIDGSEDKNQMSSEDKPDEDRINGNKKESPVISARQVEATEHHLEAADENPIHLEHKMEAADQRAIVDTRKVRPLLFFSDFFDFVDMRLCIYDIVHYELLLIISLVAPRHINWHKAS